MVKVLIYLLKCLRQVDSLHTHVIIIEKQTLFIFSVFNQFQFDFRKILIDDWECICMRRIMLGMNAVAVCTSELLNESMHTEWVYERQRIENIVCAILKWFSFVRYVMCCYASIWPANFNSHLSCAYHHTYTHTHTHGPSTHSRGSGSNGTGSVRMCRYLFRTIVRLFRPFPMAHFSAYSHSILDIAFAAACVYISPRCSKRRQHMKE